MGKSFLKSMPTSLWISGSIVIAIISLIIWLAFYGNSTATSSKSNREVALACTTDAAIRFHIHYNLEIVISGEKQTVPANIGINLGCMNAIHTHDATGQLHIESPEKRDFTLADFFAVWNKTYNRDQILDFKVDNQHVIREMVNDQEVQDYENTVIRDEDKVVIFYEERK